MLRRRHLTRRGRSDICRRAEDDDAARSPPRRTAPIYILRRYHYTLDLFSTAADLHGHSHRDMLLGPRMVMIGKLIYIIDYAAIYI